MTDEEYPGRSVREVDGITAEQLAKFAEHIDQLPPGASLQESSSRSRPDRSTMFRFDVHFVDVETKVAVESWLFATDGGMIVFQNEKQHIIEGQIRIQEGSTNE